MLPLNGEVRAMYGVLRMMCRFEILRWLGLFLITHRMMLRGVDGIFWSGVVYNGDRVFRRMLHRFEVPFISVIQVECTSYLWISANEGSGGRF